MITQWILEFQINWEEHSQPHLLPSVQEMVGQVDLYWETNLCLHYNCLYKEKANLENLKRKSPVSFHLIKTQIILLCPFC